MSLASRVSLGLLALGLSLISPALVQSELLVSTPSPPQSLEEETLRRMTEQYGLAIAAGDLEALREFWNPQSPNLASRLGVYQSFFSTSRIEFISLKVTRLEVTGERAVS